MATDADIAGQLAEYFTWLERDLGSAGLEAVTGSRTPRYRRLALVAAAVLVLGGAVAAFALTRDTTKSLHPANTTPTQSVPASIAGEWQRTGGPPITNRFQHISITTSDGWFVWGGYSALSADPPGAALTDGAYYDAVTGEWTVLPAAPFDMSDPAGSYLGWGVWTGTEVVITQGGAAPLVAAFDPVSFTWRTIPIPADILAVWPHGDGGSYSSGWQSMIGGTLAILFGHGSGATDPASMLLLDPATSGWTRATTPAALEPFRIAASPTQLFVVESGALDSTSSCLGVTWLHTYDLATDSWADAQLPNGNWQPAVVAWTGGTLLLAGGTDCPTGTSTRAAATFDPATGTWADAASLPVDDLWYLSSVTLVDGRVAAMTPEGRAIMYDPTLDAWWFSPSLTREGSTWIDDRMRLVVIDGRLAVWSPGWDVATTSMCCDSTGEVFSMPLPDATLFGTQAPPLTTPTTSAARDIPLGACVYVVQEGDFTAGLAEHFGLTVDALSAANPGWEPPVLPGEQLVIPVAPCPADTTEQMTSPTLAPPATNG